ncbi:HYES hydrolase, partial [Calyptomena viridis]|nr:HYES hydrolase [Calyptomena viridis]
GFQPCILTNSCFHDGAGRFRRAKLLAELRKHFPLFLESCRLGMNKPHSQIYSHILEVLRLKPQEV